MTTLLPVVELPEELQEPPFDLGDTGRRLYAGTPGIGHADAENGWAWAHLCAVLGGMFDPVAEVVRPDTDGNAGWTALASPFRSPPAWLRVTAQWGGVRMSAQEAMSEAELRELLATGAPGIWRATRRQIIAAIRRFLPADTADRYIFIEERVGDDPYELRVFTYTFVPHDPAKVRAALLDALPVGRHLAYEVRRGQMYAMLRDRNGGLTYDDVNAMYATYTAVHHDDPTEEVSS